MKISGSIFKYVSGEDYHIDSISKNYFYLSRVEEVDDPEDCNVSPELDLSDLNFEECIAFYKSNDRLNQLSIEEKQNICKNLTENHAIREKFRSQYIAENIIEDERYKNNVKMLCLSDTSTNLSLWKSYASKTNDLDGICLGYKADLGSPAIKHILFLSYRAKCSATKTKQIPLIIGQPLK
jgi:hypothetical protein